MGQAAAMVDALTRGYFWPGWVLGLRGVGMVMGYLDYRRKPVTESDVDAEVRTTRSKGF